MGTKATPPVACPDCKAVAYQVIWPYDCQQKRGGRHFDNCPNKNFFDGVETKECGQKGHPHHHQPKEEESAEKT